MLPVLRIALDIEADPIHSIKIIFKYFCHIIEKQWCSSMAQMMHICCYKGLKG